MGKLIEADGLKKVLEAKADLLRIGCPENQYGIFLQKVSQMIDLTPTVDAVPVIRCKDCRYYNIAERRCRQNNLDWDMECYDLWLNMEPDGFCSNGEPVNKPVESVNNSGGVNNG